MSESCSTLLHVVIEGRKWHQLEGQVPLIVHGVLMPTPMQTNTNKPGKQA